jgi:hypothetical protein
MGMFAFSLAVHKIFKSTKTASFKASRGAFPGMNRVFKFSFAVTEWRTSIVRREDQSGNNPPLTVLNKPAGTE